MPAQTCIRWKREEADPLFLGLRTGRDDSRLLMPESLGTRSVVFPAGPGFVCRFFSIATATPEMLRRCNDGLETPSQWTPIKST